MAQGKTAFSGPPCRIAARKSILRKKAVAHRFIRKCGSHFQNQTHNQAIQKISPRYNNSESEASESKDSGAIFMSGGEHFVIPYHHYHYYHRILKRSCAERRKHYELLVRNRQRGWHRPGGSPRPHR